MDVDVRVPTLSSGGYQVPIQGSTEINPGQWSYGLRARITQVGFVLLGEENISLFLAVSHV